MTPVLYLAAAACVVVAGDRIAVRDLAAIAAAFRALPPDTDLGYAPVPGSRRTFRAAELDRLLRRAAGPGNAVISAKGGDLGNPGAAGSGVSEICVERDMDVLRPEALRAALREAVSDPQAAIELIEWSGYRAPRGAIEFPRTGIALASGPSVLWHGYVRYGSGRRFAIWARVRLSVETMRVVARQNLPAGKAIRPDQLRLETVAQFPFGPRPAASLEEVSGRAPRRSLAAGAVVWPANLDAPLEIHAGDTVSVEVSSGQTQLGVEGRAAAAGRRGDIIPVHNPASGKTFRARVTGPGKAAIAVLAPWPSRELAAPAQEEKGQP